MENPATNKRSTRETVLLMLFPTIVIGAGYLMFFSKAGQLKTAAADLEKTRATAVKPEVEMLERAKAQAAIADLNRLKDEQTRLQAKRQQLLLVRETPPAARNNALRQLKDMLWQRGLHQYDDTPTEGADTQSAQALDTALKRLAPTNGGDTAKLFRIHFLGRYADVLAALETLEASQSQIIPIGLTMSEANPETTWRSWTLMFRL